MVRKKSKQRVKRSFQDKLEETRQEKKDDFYALQACYEG